MTATIALAITGAFLNNSGSQAAETQDEEPIILFDPADCQMYACSSPAYPITCVNLKRWNCIGVYYFGTKRRLP